MKKFLLLSLLLPFASQVFTAAYDARTKFLHHYYYGDYGKAHDLLRKAFQDAVARQIWDDRVHIHKDIKLCKYRDSSTHATKAQAFLRIGKIDSAKKAMGNDWLSLAGRATLASWQGDLTSARYFLQNALRQQPDRPELLYAAGQIAADEKESIAYLTRYLQSSKYDVLKRISAQQTIDFLAKTRGLDLNQFTAEDVPIALESDFEPGRLLIKAKLNESDKIKLLVDTGAAGMSLEKKDWRPRIQSDLLMIGLGKRQNSTGVLGVFDRFVSGDVHVTNAVAAISPILDAQGIDGIAGTILFSEYAILLPLKSGEDVSLFACSTAEALQYIQQKGKDYSTRITLPFYLVNKMIILKGKIKKSDEEMDILLDSGAQKSILSSATARRYTLIDYQRSHRERRSSGLAGLGGRIENFLYARNVEVEVASLKQDFKNMLAVNLCGINEALELEVDLILGQDFLKGYTLLIDYRTNQITFLK